MNNPTIGYQVIVLDRLQSPDAEYAAKVMIRDALMSTGYSHVLISDHWERKPFFWVGGKYDPASVYTAYFRRLDEAD